jgi:hypothetical protein
VKLCDYILLREDESIVHNRGKEEEKESPSMVKVSLQAHESKRSNKPDDVVLRDERVRTCMA